MAAQPRPRRRGRARRRARAGCDARRAARRSIVAHAAGAHGARPRRPDRLAAMCGIVGYVGPSVDGSGARRRDGGPARGSSTAATTRPASRCVDGDGTSPPRKRAGKLVNLADGARGRPAAGVDAPASATPAGPPTAARPTPTRTRTSAARTASSPLIHNGIIENFAALKAELLADGRRVPSPRPTPRSPRSCSAARTTRHGRPDRGDAPRSCSRLDGRLHAARGARGPARRRRRRPPQLARSSSASARARTSSAPTSPRSSSTPARRSSSARTRSSTITPDARRGHRLRRQPRPRARHYEVDWDAAAAEKGGYATFMEKEINEQPQAVADTLLGRTDADGRLVLDELRIAEDAAARRRPDRRSSPAAPPPTPAWSPSTRSSTGRRIPVEVELAHEFRYRDPVVDERTLVVSISQSGETMDTLMAVKHAREQGAQTLVDLQHPRLDDPARVRRRALHARRPRDRGRLDQGVPRPDHRAATCSASTSPSCAAARTPTRPQAVMTRAARDPGQDPAGARTASTGSARSRAGWPTPARCSSSAATSATRSRWRARSSSRSSPTSTPRASPPASSSTARSRSSSPGQPVFVVVPSPARSRTGCTRKVVSNIQEIRARGARTIVIAEEGDEDVRAVRRRGDPDPATPAAARAAAHRRAAAGLRAASWPRPRASTSTSRATSPSRSRSSRTGPPVIVGVGIDVVDVARFGQTLRAHARAARAPVHRRASATCRSTRSPRGSPPRRRWPRRSAPRSGCTGPTPRCVRGADGRPHLQVARHRRRPGPTTWASRRCTCPCPTTPASRRPSSSPRAEVTP